MRVFVALNLDRAVRKRLHGSLEALRQRDWPVRWTAASSLHLTLRFLGDIEGNEVPRIEESLRTVAARHGPQRLELAGFGAFPSLRRASVLWVGVTPDPALMALQRELELAMSRLGYGREQKPFRPHVTVARLRAGARTPDVERDAAGYEHTDNDHVETMDLMRSHTDPGGARYETLLRIALGQEADT
ncbi:MAG TPA: RNA 2',3'-cyclic phosphodiesterase [Longimicrobiales bacterium]|nr:RNA 2',3'-cyclic phosphodiesterase [Longimicrobiales bacterium]